MITPPTECGPGTTDSGHLSTEEAVQQTEAEAEAGPDHTLM